MSKNPDRKKNGLVFRCIHAVLVCFCVHCIIAIISLQAANMDQKINILCKLDIPEVGYLVLHSRVDSYTPCNYT